MAASSPRLWKLRCVRRSPRLTGDADLTRRWFEDMFTTSSDAAVATSVIERAAQLPREIGEKVLLDMVRYDVDRLGTALAEMRVPVMAIQTHLQQRAARATVDDGRTRPRPIWRCFEQTSRRSVSRSSQRPGTFRRSTRARERMPCWRISSPHCRQVEPLAPYSSPFGPRRRHARGSSERTQLPVDGN